MNAPPPDKPRDGLVTVSHGNASLVETTDGALVLCHHRRNQPRPVCGDRVRWRWVSDSGGVVESIRPRRSLLERPDFRGRPRPLAANVTLLVLVVAPEPGIDTGLIDRYLVLATHLHARAVLWVNKADLLPHPELPDPDALLRRYAGLGMPGRAGSVKHGTNLDWLRGKLADETAILVGHSGVGKSSLLETLIPDLEVRINALSEASGHGRHTTTATTLFHLPGGGQLIDSPGIRNFRLDHMDRETLLAAFPDLTPYLNACRFANCRHDAEPGCAVKQALAKGEILPERLASFQKLLAEVRPG
ncbi:ribosome small subunit-dependent GTPase A [Ectothiorhodospiraceae bacterium WFHF3C12]|nr:ribosome small subunit-dependent GTPase A [Ectothiorhodospiraceae bacterium WFHF3C12]